MDSNTNKNGPLPTGEQLEQLRIMTSENDHSGARLFAAKILSNLWLERNARDAYANPFLPLVAAMAQIVRQHQALGHMPASLVGARFALWGVAYSLAEDNGLGAAARALREAL